MAKQKICADCGQSLIDGNCVNDQCSAFDAAATRQVEMTGFGSLVPDEMVSMDASQIIDYTGTIGIAPDSGIHDSLMVHSQEVDADVAATRMVDDDFYQQIQQYFPADSGSQSSRAADSDSRGSASDGNSNPDASQSLSLRGVRDEVVTEEFVPPIRDIHFPSDTKSLDGMREAEDIDFDGDEYRIVDKLGEGGYGVVFQAEQLALNRPVAVKVLKPKRKKPGSKALSRTGTGTGELQRRRDQFLHEAKITARLQHPNIVPLYDFGINSQGQLFYSMKQVERRPWSSVIDDPAKLLNISESEVDDLTARKAISRNVEIFDRVCDAMAYTHAKQVIHRDLKPDNIMIGDYGEVLLIDFGMALDFAAGQPEFSAGGTLVYMAPEMARHFAKQKEIQVIAQKTARKLGVDDGSIFLDQSNLMGIGRLASDLIQKSKDEGVIELAESLIRLDSEEKKLAAEISYASDIYLLGAILYQLAVGHPPHYFPISACKKGRSEKFQKELWLALRNGFQQYQEVTDPLRISLRNIAARAMRLDPSERFQTVEELQEAIGDFQREVQSLEMTETGKEELEKAAGGEGYQHLLPALESFRGARALWPESAEAKQLQVRAACEYATRANRQKDYDAGLSILNEYVLEEHRDDEAVVTVRKKLNDGRSRRTRNRRLAAVGWVAAVTLPIAVWVYSLYQTADIRQQVVVAKEQMETFQTQAVEFEGKAKEQEEIANEKTLVAQTQTRIAEEKTREAMDQIAKAEAFREQAVKFEKDSAEFQTKAAEFQKQAVEQERIANMQRAAAAEQKQLAEQAAKDKELFEKAALESRQLADKYQFDVDFGEYNANVLTIPLDLRTGKLNEVDQKLTRLDQSNAKPQFKNGWEVDYFAKRANVAGTNQRPDDAEKIVDVVSVEESNDAYIIGMVAGQPTLWRMQADGKSKMLDLELPRDGNISAAAVSPDGDLLALSVDNVTTAEDSPGEPLWVVRISDGTRIDVDEVDGIVGSRSLTFAKIGDQSRLVSVEEISGYRGLKSRLQVVTRELNGNKLTVADSLDVDATTRDEGRVDYLASVSQAGTVGLAYQSLDSVGADIFRLETIELGAASNAERSAISVERFPTALHVTADNKLYCGHADGAVDQFRVSDLKSEPTLSANRNESEIVSMDSTADGRLVSGSVNGVMVVWNSDLTVNKTLQGQPDQISTLAISEGDDVSGFEMVSGDQGGNVRFWQPETSLHDARIRKSSPVTVTCAAVDAGLSAADVPATAYGTAKGQVYYFSSDAMTARGGGETIGDLKDSGSATFRFKSPFESYGTAFADFDSMGIVGDQFVLMKDDGTFGSQFIDTRADRIGSASPRTQRADIANGRNVVGKFVPLLASVHDQDYFFTTDPLSDDGLVAWSRSDNSFNYRRISLDDSSRGRIKRLKMSPDGKWLVVVRQLGRETLAGKYVAEIYDCAAGTGAIQLVSPTDVFEVGDPAFVGFSKSSDEMVLHFHKRAPDRETWIETWSLTGSQWKKSEKERIDNRRVDLVALSGDDQIRQLITKINRKYYLATESGAGEFDRESFAFDSGSARDRLRSVRPTGKEDKFYVLSTNELDLYTNTTLEKTANLTPPIQHARDLRVFGDRAVILDDNGFHLIDAELNYVSKLAARQEAVRSVALSDGRLAITYTNDLCRIWDVRGEKPTGIGAIEDAASVQLSPDGKWAAGIVDDKISVYDSGSDFEQAKLQLPAAGATISWTSDAASRLLIATSADGKIAWQEVDPATGNTAPPQPALPTAIAGLTRFQLAPFSQNYLAVDTADGLQLWTTGEKPERLNRADHQFDDRRLSDVASFSFSEQDLPVDQIGTRLVALAGSGDGDAELEPHLYLIASEEGKEEGGLMTESKFRVVEVEGTFEKTQGLDVLDARFSGDGGSLLLVDEKGINTLIGE